VKSFFINEAFDKAIKDYLASKDKPEGVLYNSFLVVVIRMLVNIYGELDIINPYLVKDEVAFDSNLTKYGASIDKVLDLRRLVSCFYQIELRNVRSLKRENNPYFIEVQKCIIDLFDLKAINNGIEDSKSKEFFDLLYTPGTSNALRLSYNFLNAENIYEIAEYYKNVLEDNPQKKEIEEKKDLLGFDIYKLFNYSIADLSKMNNDEVTKLNSEIYRSLDISENAINKEYLLEEKLKEIRMQNNPVTTGNGYVDILLIMSVIITVIMVVVIFGTIII